MYPDPVPDHIPLHVGEDVAGFRQGGDLFRLETKISAEAAGFLLRQMSLGAGEFPKICQKTLGRAFSDPISRSAGAGSVFDQKDRPFFDLSGFFFVLCRQLFLAAGAECLTKARPGTVAAKRGPVGQTDCGTQIHQRLVHISRPVFRKKGTVVRLRQLFRGGSSYTVFISGSPGEDPEQVPIHRGHRHPKGDGGDGCRRIGTDPGKLLQFFRVRGDLSAEVFHDLKGGFVHVPDPAVIAQPLPKLQQEFLLCLCQRFHIRQFL